MTYDDMTMVQLKALCKNRGLGTGRSKQDLIEKLETDDRDQVRKLADLPDEELLELVEEGEPVDIEPARIPEPAPEVEPELEPKDEDPSPTVFRITVSHSGPLLDTEHEAFRRRTYGLALADGLTPYGGEFAARLIKSENGQLTYELEVHG